MPLFVERNLLALSIIVSPGFKNKFLILEIHSPGLTAYLLYLS